MKNKYLIFTLFILFFLSFILFYSEIKQVATVILSTFGLTGVFIVTMILDMLIQPISPDMLAFSSSFGGISPYFVVLVAGIASCTAASIDYFFGRKLGAKGFKKWFGEEHLDKGQQLINKYGVLGVIVGALSPVPFSAVCWAAGIYHMKFNKFILTCLLTRIPRFCVMALLGFIL